MTVKEHQKLLTWPQSLQALRKVGVKDDSAIAGLQQFPRHGNRKTRFYMPNGLVVNARVTALTHCIPVGMPNLWI